MTRQPPTTTPRARLPLVLDVDTGVDDAIALALACADGAAELLGVTCVAGNTRLPDVVTNTRTLLAHCGREDVPVAAGAQRSLVRAPTRTDGGGVHGGRGRGYAVLDEDLGPTTSRPAAQFIVDAVRDRPGQVTLVTTGPLTNLALAIALEPELPRLLGHWVLMGGAYAQVRGNTTPAAEFNIHADPEAAHVAFGAFVGAPRLPTAVGLDVTHRIRLLPHHLEALAERCGERLDVRAGGHAWGTPSSPLLAYLEGALRAYAEYHERQHGFYGVYVHDAVAVAAALHPELLECRPVAVDVECHGASTLGQTVADWQSVTGLPANVDVAVALDDERVLDLITDAVVGLAATAGGGA